MRSTVKAVAINAAVVTALVGGGVAYVSFDSAVALSVDGERESIHTFGDTVGDVLNDQGIDVGPHDEVVPSLASPVNDGTDISLRYGREVSVTIDGEKDTFWTTALSVDEVISDLGIRANGAEISVDRSRSISRDGLNFEIQTAKELTLIADGETKAFTTTALTVGDALTDAGVELQDLDIVRPTVDTALDGNLKVVVKRVTVKKATVEEALEHETREEEDDTLEAGTTEVDTEGKDGLVRRLVEKTYIDGKLDDTKVIRETVVKKPVTEIVLVGTAEPDDGGGSDNVDGGVWDDLAECESGGDWHINTGNGYYGGLQFNFETWQAYGGSGYPHENSKEEQIRIAEKVRDANGGYGAWPHCAAELGLPT